MALQIVSAFTSSSSLIFIQCECVHENMHVVFCVPVCIACNVSLFCCSSAESEELAVHLYPGAVTVQGVLRRKTVLKEGKKPTVRSHTHVHTCIYTRVL